MTFDTIDDHIVLNCLVEIGWKNNCVVTFETEILQTVPVACFSASQLLANEVVLHFT